MKDLLPSLIVFGVFAVAILLMGALQARTVVKPPARWVDGNITRYHTYPGIANYVYAILSVVMLLFSLVAVVTAVFGTAWDFDQKSLKDTALSIFVICAFLFMIICSIKFIISNTIYYIIYSDSCLSFNDLVRKYDIYWSDISQIKLEESNPSRILLKNGDKIKFSHAYAGIIEFYDMATLKGIDIQQ